MTIPLIIILLKILLTNDTWILNAIPAGDSILRYALSRLTQQAAIPFILHFVLPWLQTEILHGLEESKPELEKGTTLIWNLQIVKSTSAYLLRMGESREPNGNKHKDPKTIWKMAKIVLLTFTEVISTHVCV